MQPGWINLSIILLGLPLILSACTTLDESQCQTTNWRDLGQRNGQQGRASSYVAEDEEACARFGIPVDNQSWRAGWEVGIREYCTPQNGLNAGMDGKSYAQSCPADVALGFVLTYAIGKRLYDTKQDRDTIRRDIDTLTESITSASDESERSKLQSQLFVKQNDLYRAQNRLTDAERDADRVRFSR